MGPLHAGATLADRPGVYRLTLAVGDAHRSPRRSVSGLLTLRARSADAPRFGGASTPLHGSADIDLRRIGAHVPGNVALCGAQQEANDALRARVDTLTESNRRLEHLVSVLRRFIYGKKSEKLAVDERQLALEDLEGAVTAVAEAAPAPRAPSASAPKRSRSAGRCSA